uniref:Uncharacterized protein n=1 Tax=Panagrolaimus superbus TaxID=310955 RepID=A0A914XWE7_9BILA
MKTTSLMLAIFFIFTYLSINPNAAASGIDWGKVDPLCTISCGAYWFCMIKGKGCKQPKNCICEEFPRKG